MHRTPHVLVAGAGIGGLTAALSLHAAGIGVTVIESARRIGALGVGINLQPHAVRELTELGLADQLAAAGVPAAEIRHLDRHGRTVAATAPLGRAAGYRWPQYAIHRGALQMLLLDAVTDRLGATAVRAGTRLDAVEETPGGVRAVVTDRSTGRTAGLAADVLVGADGLHSRVRAHLHPDLAPPRWSGGWMWRGATEAPPFLTGRSMILANDERGGRIVAYPISPRPTGTGRSLINWVALVPVAEPGEWHEEFGWDRAGQLDDLLPHFADWDLTGVGLDLPALFAGAARPLEYPMLDRDPLPFWTRGRVTLLGDAAHLMYPVGANGAQQAVLDARTLAYQLVASDDPAEALAAYEDIRRPATAAVVLANRERDRADHEVARGTAAGVTLADAHASYLRAAHSDVTSVNDRPSLTPPALTTGR